MATLLILVTFVVFWQVHSYEFVLWDDGLHVFENPYFQSLTFNNILAFWREPYAELYIPPHLYALGPGRRSVMGEDCQFAAGAPLDPWFFHTLNLLVSSVDCAGRVAYRASPPQPTQCQRDSVQQPAHP